MQAFQNAFKKVQYTLTSRCGFFAFVFISMSIHKFLEVFFFRNLSELTNLAFMANFLLFFFLLVFIF